MAKRLFCLVTILCLAACASAPVNFGKPDPSSRIGVILLIDEKPKHSHVGTTIFQNSDALHSSNTDFRARFESRVSDSIRQGGYQAQVIEPTDLLVDNRMDLFSYASSDIYFEKPIKAELNRIGAELGLDFVILVYPVSGPAWVNSSANIDGYGLYTQCSFGKCTAQALSYVSSRIYDVNNQSSLKGAGFRFFQNPPMPGSYSTEDLKVADPKLVDDAAALALDSFMVLFANMFRTSQFIE